MNPGANVEAITFTGGFGPLQAKRELRIEIRPFTIFIGPQGTGKSLVSQLTYFFRDAKYLLSRYAEEKTDAEAVRQVVEGLRTGGLTGRRLASFLTTPTARVSYSGQIKGSSKTLDRSISITQANRRILPLKPFKDEVEKWFSEWAADPSSRRGCASKAMFIPAERTHFSRFINSDPALLGHRALPLTMLEFSRVLTSAGETFQMWQDDPSQYPRATKEIDELTRKSLGGTVKYARAGRYAGKWQWIPDSSDRPIELEMASSGQMEAWPLIFTAQAIFGWSESHRPEYLHIEEPEAHLHPAAQVAMVHVLAYLVYHGFKVLVTTHSLTVLYAVNNLTLAYQKMGREKKERVPDPQLRLEPGQVSAYLFDGAMAEKIVDQDGQIDEGRLGKVLGDLEIQFNHIMAYGTLWE